MNKKSLSLATLFLLFFSSAPFAGEPTYKQGVDIFIETGVTQPDSTPTWYAPMMAMPYAPVF